MVYRVCARKLCASSNCVFRSLVSLHDAAFYFPRAAMEIQKKVILSAFTMVALAVPSFSYAASGALTTSSGSLAIFHTQCTEFTQLSGAPTGSGSAFTFDSCTGYDTTMSIQAIHFFLKSAGFMVVKIGLLFCLGYLFLINLWAACKFISLVYRQKIRKR